MAIVVAPLTTAVMNAVPETESGVASAVNNAASRLAGLVSVVVVGLVAASVYLQYAHSLAVDGTPELRFGILPAPSTSARPALEAAFAHAYWAAMLVAVALGGLAAMTAAFCIKARA
jgi:hypothetical protein